MKLSRTASIILLIVANIAIDQISKFIVRAKIAQNEVIEVIGDTFIMDKVEISGAFLGMGSEFGHTVKWILLLILPIIFLGGVIYYIITNKALDRLSLIAFCFIVG